MRARYSASATSASHLASRTRAASFAGRGAAVFCAAPIAPVEVRAILPHKTKPPRWRGQFPERVFRSLKASVLVLARDHALQAAAGVDDAAGHYRLDEGRRRGELQPWIGGKKQRALILRDEAELAGAQSELALTVAHHHFAVRDPYVYRRVQARPNRALPAGGPAIARRGTGARGGDPLGG